MARGNKIGTQNSIHLQVAFGALIGAGIILLTSCNITNPPAYVNTQAHKPTAGEYSIQGIQPGETFSQGNISFSVDFIQKPFNSNSATVSVSGKLLQYVGGPPFKFQFEVYKLPGGYDTLDVFIMAAHDPSLGLINGLTNFGVLVTIPVYVDTSSWIIPVTPAGTGKRAVQSGSGREPGVSRGMSGLYMRDPSYDGGSALGFRRDSGTNTGPAKA